MMISVLLFTIILLIKTKLKTPLMIYGNKWNSITAIMKRRFFDLIHKLGSFLVI
jgi:hypothetical protein